MADVLSNDESENFDRELKKERDKGGRNDVEVRANVDDPIIV